MTNRLDRWIGRLEHDEQRAWWSFAPREYPLRVLVIFALTYAVAPTDRGILETTGFLFLTSHCWLLAPLWAVHPLFLIAPVHGLAVESERYREEEVEI